MNIDEQCAYSHCENEAEFIDELGDFVCCECMEREVEEGSATYEDFESMGEKL